MLIALLALPNRCSTVCLDCIRDGLELNGLRQAYVTLERADETTGLFAEKMVSIVAAMPTASPPTVEDAIAAPADTHHRK